jgi:ABC-2 type transport system permease protein
LGKIFKYELRRLLLNKFFIGLLIINGLFAWYILTGDTVAGVSYTAPFSPWSFGAYMASVMPVSMLTVLFLLTAYYSKKEKQAEALTAATPVDAVRYALVRLAAVALGYVILLSVTIGLSAYFYIAYFDFRQFSIFILPACVTVIPCFILILGLGCFTGRIHSGLLYALMFVMLALIFLEIPGAFDFFGGGYYSSAPASLPQGADGEPAYILSAAFLAARAIYLAAGSILLIAGVRRAAPGEKPGRVVVKG